VLIRLLGAAAYGGAVDFEVVSDWGAGQTYLPTGGTAQAVWRGIEEGQAGQVLDVEWSLPRPLAVNEIEFDPELSTLLSHSDGQNKFCAIVEYVPDSGEDELVLRVADDIVLARTTEPFYNDSVAGRVVGIVANKIELYPVP
jgi:hypothetical protein